MPEFFLFFICLSFSFDPIHHTARNCDPALTAEQLSKVRSIDVFGKVKSIPPLSSFRVLRVLEVDDCSSLDSNHPNDLGKFCLLRFLRLQDFNDTKLPERIGELELLDTLDIRQSGSITPVVLPVSFSKLGKLVRLLGTNVEIPDGLTLENMTFLRDLGSIWASYLACNQVW